MRALTFKLGILLLCLLIFLHVSVSAEENYPQVKMTIEYPFKGKTVKESIVIELYNDAAKITVDNFLKYVNEGFYDGTVFHRVINGFMIQGGGFTSELERKNTHPPIFNEADNGLKNSKGTIAMARTNKIHSATSQFFINVADNDFLNYKSQNQYGYAVFGKVIEGIETVDKIKIVPTGIAEGMRDVPVNTVIILKAEQIKSLSKN